MAKKMTDADKAKAKIKDTTKTVTKSGRTITSSATSSYPKDIKKGSMAGNSKIVEMVPPKKKASAKYSPAAMSEKAKKAAARGGEKKQAVIGIKKDLKKIAGAAGKAAGLTAKAATLPSRMIIKGAKAAASELSSPKRQVGKGGTVKKLKDIKKLNK